MQSRLKNFLKLIHLNESTISTLLGGLVLVIVGVLIFNYVRQTRENQQITQEAASEEIQQIGEIQVEKDQEGKLVPTQLPSVYEVKKDDSLWKIAEAHYASGYNWVDIAQENNLAQPDLLAEGQKLTIPKVEVRTPTQAQALEESLSILGNSYEVQKGDNLWEIAIRAYGDGYKWPEIAEANSISNPDQIEIGQKLTLPGK